MTSGTTWPYTAIGVGFAVLGVACSGYGFKRHREVERAIRSGDVAHPDERVIALLSGVAVPVRSDAGRRGAERALIQGAVLRRALAAAED